MTFMTLTATPQPRATESSTPLNLTTLLAAGSIGSNTGVEFANDNRSVLFVEQGTAASTVVVAIGATVEGEPVTSITYAGAASDILMIGPFDDIEDVEPGDLIQVTFGTPANIAGVALISNSGAV